MTNEEFQQQIEQMLAIQRSLQESDLRRAEQFEQVNQQLGQVNQQFEQVNQQFEQVGQQFEQASERMDRTDQQLAQLAQHVTQLTQLMTIQGQRFALVTEALGIQEGQIRELDGRVDILENG